MKTVIYARKSTLKDGQKDTIENQIKICRRRAKELGLTIVDIKKDSASGTTDNNRDEVKELIKGAIDGKYECVIMKGISRFYRDVEHGLGLIKKLDRSNIRVITVEENFDSYERRTGNGQLDTSMITMYLMFAENESKKLGDRIKHTQIEKAYAGEWNQAGSPPFGYKYNHDTKKLDINYPSSDIIKLIFNLYLDGLGMKAIAHYLNGDNEESIAYASPKGKLWSQYTIGFMLKNQVYVGDVVFNKRSKKSRPYKNPEAIGKNDDDVYVGNDYNNVEEWIITKDAHEAIVSRETFQAVQSIMGVKAIRTGIKNNISLLAGIAKCGKCGIGMTFKRGNKNKLGQINTKNNYYCSNYIKYGKRYCDSHHVGSTDFEELIINRLKEHITNKISYNDVVHGVKKNRDDSDSSVGKVKKIEKDIESLSRKIDVLLDKNIEGTISDNQFGVLNEKYIKELNLLTHQLAQLKIQDVDMKEKRNTKDYLVKVYEEMMSIEKYPKEKQRYLILDLINQIKVTDGKIEIDYKI